MSVAQRKYDKHLGFKIDSETHYKLGYVAKYEGRSSTAHILYLVRRNIREFEAEHGEIEYPPRDEQT